ncbi:nucleolar transcription factor 1-B-like [Myxocyprinus asiaticus]|uniref:nucleolar transcription factor 1-B-like n=1 Tax=Myxocyprinus asiaticus TaxID=70543 RepID=UPI002222B5C9|nr:nucleolar transcription factor 1-B-like [Myxocyprinus asiaticus]
MMSDTVDSNSTPTVIALLFIWVILVLALVYLYKRLNADTNGQYTVQRVVFAEGGLRDRLRQGVGSVENRFGLHIWPQPHDEEQKVIRGDDGRDEEEDDNDKQNESHANEDEEQEDDDVKDDSLDDYSSVDLREKANLRKEDKKSDAEEVEEKEKQNEAAAGEEDKQGEEEKNEEKVGLLVDLKPFSGSAIWSEENKDGGNDLTAL